MNLWGAEIPGPDSKFTYTIEKLSIPHGSIITHIALGAKHGHFVTNANSVYSWGEGASWRLGTGDKKNLDIPTKIETLQPDIEIKQICCGEKFTALLSKTGRVFVWGAGYSHFPTLLEAPNPIKFIACGLIWLVCVLSDGSIIQYYRHNSPIQRRFARDKIIAAACGYDHRIALAESGLVYSWGSSIATGQGNIEKPKIIDTLFGTPIKSVFAYHYSTFFIDNFDNIWCCGNNVNGCLGIGHFNEVPTPVQQSFSFDSQKIIQIVCGCDFTLYLSEYGNVWCSGIMEHSTSELMPIPISFGLLNRMNITNVSAGHQNFAFLEGIDDSDAFTNYLSTKNSKYSIRRMIRLKDTKELIELDKSKSFLLYLGFMIGDIVIINNKEAKVIGTNKGNLVVVFEKEDAFSLEQHNPFELAVKYHIKSREGAELISYKYADNELIQVDSQYHETIKFGGLLAGDIINGDLTVAGTRCGFLWVKNKNNYIEPFKDNLSFLSVMRQGKSVKQVKDTNGLQTIIEESTNDHNLYFSSEYGICYFIGYQKSSYCYEFLYLIGVCHVLDSPLPILRHFQGSHPIDYICNGEQISVETSIEKCEEYYRFDRVICRNKKGSVQGISNGKVCILFDHCLIHGYEVTLVPSCELLLIGRVGIPGIRTIQYQGSFFDISVSTDDFSSTSWLPDDRIDDENGLGYIIGIKDGIIFAQFDNSDEIRHIKSPKLVRRSIDCTGKSMINGVDINVSLMKCCLLHFKPMDILMSNQKTLTFLGFGSFNELVFRNSQNEICNNIQYHELDFQTIKED